MAKQTTKTPKKDAKPAMKAEKAKKPSDSAEESGVSKLLKDITNKIVSNGAAALGAVTASKPEKKSAKTPVVTAAMPAVTTPEPVKVPLVVDVPVDPEDEEIFLTDAEGRRYCRATDCDQVGLVDGYCRYHYLYFWKKIQVRKKILADGKLERYIEELTSRYVDKFVELLRKDLRTEKDFLAAVAELELDDSANAAAAGDEDEAKTYIEEISGVAAETGRDEEGF
jgi:hypothetical protein